MRPSDEHQHRSNRPNLFSTSRGKGGADDNILARLERMPADTAAASMGRSRMLLLGGAGVLIAGLVGTLAMITRDNVNAPRAQQAPATVAVAKPASAPAADLPVASLPPQARMDDMRATILDEAPADAPAADAIPAGAQPSPERTDIASAATTTTPPRIARAQPARTALPAESPRTQNKPQGASAKPPRRSAPTSSEDPDVAVLAAILSQAPRHSTTLPSSQAGEPECGSARGKPCPSSQF